MTTDIIELSKQAAEVLGVPAYTNPYFEAEDKLWLAQDHARCAEIAADRLISTSYYTDSVEAWYVDEAYLTKQFHSYYADHNNNRLKAYCVAICRAVLEQEKQS